MDLKKFVCILALLLNITILAGWVLSQDGKILETDLMEPETAPGKRIEKEMFDKGVVLLKQEKYTEAVQAFTALIQISPRAADAYKNRGVAYMKQNLYDQAIEDFEKTIEIQPDLKGLYSNLGVAWYYQKDHRKAIENYDREIQLSPNAYFTYFNRAICWAELGEKQKSLEDIDRTLAITPDLYPALCLKGDLLAGMQRPVLARQAYEKAVSVDPAQTYARTKLAQLRDDPAMDNTPDPAQTGVTGPKSPDGIHGKKTAGDAAVSTQKVYELQLGAFRGLENAKTMQAQLEKSGIKTRLMIVTKEAGNPWHFVRTGSYPNYAQARDAEKRFEEKTGMDVMVKLSTRW